MIRYGERVVVTRAGAVLLASWLLVGCDCAAPIESTDGGRADDSGVDGGPPDAGPEDGGPTDASVDAGTDAGSVPGHVLGCFGAGGVAGLRFRSGDLAGWTDGAGAFERRPGEPVAFSVGDIAIGSATLDRPLLFDLVGEAGCAVTPALRSLLVLLESLDADHDPGTGLAIPEIPEPAPSAMRPLAGLSDQELADAIGQMSPSAAVVSQRSAVDAFVRCLDEERWQEEAPDTFTLLDAAERSQGVTTDGTDWFFSWRFGLQRTDDAFGTLVDAPAAIPLFLGGGLDHIGDIDVHGGTVFAPLEDSQAYAHPTIALYDAATLQFTGQAFELPTSLLSKGVPWVAVDGPRALAWVAEWDPTPELHALRLPPDMTLVRSVALGTVLGRIQGAKVFRGMLYASLDTTPKVVKKVNLDTGTVIDLFALGGDVSESEGIALREGSGGPELRVLAAVGYEVDLRRYRLASPPRREALCAGR